MSIEALGVRSKGVAMLSASFALIGTHDSLASALVGESSSEQNEGKTNYRIHSTIDDSKASEECYTISWLRAASTRIRGMIRRKLRMSPSNGAHDYH